MWGVVIRAYLARNYDDFLRKTVRLMIARRGAPGYEEVWMGGGIWRSIPEGTVTEEPPGVLLPLSAVDAIREAIEEFDGNKSHGATEAKVLREWLAVEQARVDKALEA